MLWFVGVILTWFTQCSSLYLIIQNIAVDERDKNYHLLFSFYCVFQVSILKAKLYWIKILTILKKKKFGFIAANWYENVQITFYMWIFSLREACEILDLAKVMQCHKFHCIAFFAKPLSVKISIFESCFSYSKIWKYCYNRCLEQLSGCWLAFIGNYERFDILTP